MLAEFQAGGQLRNCGIAIIAPGTANQCCARTNNCTRVLGCLACRRLFCSYGRISFNRRHDRINCALSRTQNGGGETRLLKARVLGALSAGHVLTLMGRKLMTMISSKLAIAAAVMLALIAGNSAQAAIVTSGSVGAAAGTPYNGTDNPWNVSHLDIGESAAGSLGIGGGFVVNDASSSFIAIPAAASTSAVTVDGPNSKWAIADGLYVNFGGNGMLSITNGGSVSSSYTYIGYASGSSGLVTVDGAGSVLSNSDSGLTVGLFGDGRLTITGGGSAITGSGAVIGAAAGSTGSVSVEGAGSTLTDSSLMFIGGGGTGALKITGGGSVSSPTNINGYTAYISDNNSSTGSVTVGGGVGVSTWSNAGALIVGFPFSTGSGTLNLLTGGVVSATGISGGNAMSSVNFDGGTLSITDNNSASNTINLLSGGGTLDVPTPNTTLNITGNIGGAGGLTKTGLGSLSLGGASSYSGATTVSAGTLQGTGSVTGEIDVASAATLAPGNSVGTLSTGSVSIAAGGTLAVEINQGATPGADFLDITGSLALNGAILNLAIINRASVSVPKTFLVARNDGSDAISGAFGSITGLPSGVVATVNYAFIGTDFLGRSGNGNDLAVTLSAVPEPNTGLLAVTAFGFLLWPRRQFKR